MNHLRNFILHCLCLCTVSTMVFSQASAPCQSELHSQFDFWVGEWEVYDSATDSLLGRSQIRRILGGCVIEEHWRGQSGTSGKSFNTLNPSDSTWTQFWVDNTGASHTFVGRFSDGNMQMRGGSTSDTLFRMIYYPSADGRTVRQVWERKSAPDAQWQVIFDGIYRSGK